MPDSLLIAILAAGASRRLGSPKQLVSLDGETLLHRQCRIALEAQLGPVVTILGCKAEPCQEAVEDLSVGIVLNKDWEEGMSSSLRHAVQAAVVQNCHGLLILLVDQYLLTSDDLKRLVAKWKKEPTKIAISLAENYQGPPVLFPDLHYAALLQLKGDAGARNLLRQLPESSIQFISIAHAAADCDHELDRGLVEQQAKQESALG
jgi:molybdenum cofactor cytidylyltransferase